MAGEDREFRIYTSEHGENPVIKDIRDEKLLEYWLVACRQMWPGSDIVVREVMETVVAVYHPDWASDHFGPPYIHLLPPDTD